MLSLVQRCVVRRVRREANCAAFLLFQAQGCTPSSWVPEGTLEVKVIDSGGGAGNQQVLRDLWCVKQHHLLLTWLDIW